MQYTTWWCGHARRDSGALDQLHTPVLGDALDVPQVRTRLERRLQACMVGGGFRVWANQHKWALAHGCNRHLGVHDLRLRLHVKLHTYGHCEPKTRVAQRGHTINFDSRRIRHEVSKFQVPAVGSEAIQGYASVGQIPQLWDFFL